MHVFMCVLRMRIHVCNNFTYACMYATKYLCMFVYTLCKYIACMLVLSKYACMHVCVYVCLCVFVCVHLNVNIIGSSHPYKSKRKWSAHSTQTHPLSLPHIYTHSLTRHRTACNELPLFEPHGSFKLRHCNFKLVVRQLVCALQCRRVILCLSALQCGAVWCSVVQCGAVWHIRICIHIYIHMHTHNTCV